MTVSAGVNLRPRLISIQSSQLWTDAPLDDVRNGARKHLQALWHLQGDHCSVVFPHMEYSFVYFERVIAWKLSNGCVELRILENILRDLVAHGGRPWARRGGGF
jgi:hypothetical protein